MSLNNPTGTNDRGRRITYDVHDTITGELLFTCYAGRFSTKHIRGECSFRNITLPVDVRWYTNNRWGMNFKHRLVSA
jgi:hypothetical protein